MKKIPIFTLVITLLFLNGCEIKSALPSTSDVLTPNSPSYSTESYIIPRWDDMTVSEKYNHEISFDGITYLPNRSEIDSFAIDEFLGYTETSGYDVYDNNRVYTINCNVYSLKSISIDCAVAVKFEGYDEYYSFVSSYYVPATLEDLINDLNLHENLVFNKIYYSYWKDGIVANGNYTTMEYTLPDTSVVWDLLLTDTSLINLGDVNYTVAAMDISIDVKIVGHKNISLAVNDDGYLQTNILNTGKSFFIGKEKVQAFMDYVLINGTGTVYEIETEELILE